jgi:hypothetical protein
MILSPRVGFGFLTTGTGFNWAGELQKRGGSDKRAATTMRKLGWQLGFMVRAKLAWVGVEEVHPSLYRGVGGVRMD